MIVHRAFASRRGLRRPARAASRVLRATTLFSLSTLLGGLVLPVATLVLARDSAPVCCSRGRCCCADDSAARDERTCLRRGCGCEHGSQAVSGELLGIEATLPCSLLLTAAAPAEGRWALPNEQPLERAQQPIVPPPRCPLPA